MTVASSTNKITYAGNGSTRKWPFTFKVLDPSHLQVIVTDTNGAETTLSAGYSVDLDDNVVTYPIDDLQDPLPSGYKITLLRWLPIVQELDLKNQSNYEAEALEREYDYLTMTVQQLKEITDRSLVFPVSSNDTARPEYLLNAMQTATSNAQKYAEQAKAHEESVSTTASEAISEVNSNTESALANIQEASDSADYALQTIDEKTTIVKNYADTVSATIDTHNADTTANAAAIQSQVPELSFTVSDGTAPSSDTAVLKTLLSNLANRIKQIKGTSSWRDDNTSIATLNSENSARLASINDLYAKTNDLYAKTTDIYNRINGRAWSPASSGYLKLDANHGSFIIQWGIVSRPDNDSGTLVTFPITFPNTCLSVVAYDYTKIVSTSQCRFFGNGVNTAYYLAIGY